MDNIKKKLTLKAALDYLEELDYIDDGDADDVCTVFIEPPENEGYISGEDDAEDELGGVPDNVCSGQLKANCEIVLRSGRRVITLCDENDDDFELDVEDALQDLQNHSSQNVSVALLGDEKRRLNRSATI